jgi:hypothetical protein
VNGNIFIKIITLADLDRAALNDTETYEKVKNALFMLLKGEVLSGTLAQLNEDKALNQIICKLLKTIYDIVLKDLEGDTLKETLNKIKKD